jgi:hypothetical protein
MMMLVGLALLLPSASRADGLIYQLPPDGSWVRFAGCGRYYGYERIRPANAAGKDDASLMPDEEYQGGVGTFVLQSVGTADNDGEKCRWIEFKTEPPKEFKGGEEVWKMLIPERRLKEGSDPFDHIQKMYIKAGFVKDGLERVDTDKKLMTYELQRIRKWFPSVPAESKRQKNYFIRINGRDVRGESVRFDSYFEGKLHRGTAGFYSNRCRHHTVLDPNAPFGVAFFSDEGDSVEKYEDDSGWKSKFREEFWMVDSGTGAKTALPDHE